MSNPPAPGLPSESPSRKEGVRDQLFAELQASVDLRTAWLEEQRPGVYLLLSIHFLSASATLLKMNGGCYFHMFLLKVCLCKWRLLGSRTSTAPRPPVTPPPKQKLGPFNVPKVN